MPYTIKGKSGNYELIFSKLKLVKPSEIRKMIDKGKEYN